jgi:hypothetical protein
MTPWIGDRYPGDTGRHHDVEGGVQALVRGDGGVGAVGDRFGAAVLIADTAAHIEIQLAAGGAPVVLAHDGVGGTWSPARLSAPASASTTTCSSGSERPALSAGHDHSCGSSSGTTRWSPPP